MCYIYLILSHLCTKANHYFVILSRKMHIPPPPPPPPTPPPPTNLHADFINPNDVKEITMISLVGVRFLGFGFDFITIF